MRTTATRPLPHDDRLRKPSRAAGHVVRITAILLALGLLGACSIRLETPAQVEPSPGAVEQVRARTLDDATDLAEAAQSALATQPSQAVTAVLTDVAEFSDQHAAQLGPAYDSGLTPSPTVTTAPPASDPAAVLADLADATRTALADADDVDDAGLARLVASIASARDQLTRRLARATGVDTPDLDVVVQPTPAPSPTGSPAPEPTPSPEQTQAAQASSADDLDALVLAHDQAGYAYEVIAAQQSGDVRTRARDAAAAHRYEAQRWAVAAGTAQTKDDPRRAAYALPDGLTTTKTARRLAVSLESAIAEADATLVARTPAGERQPFMDGLRTATAAARSWGGAAVAFPGLPERAQS